MTEPLQAALVLLDDLETRPHLYNTDYILRDTLRAVLRRRGVLGNGMTPEEAAKPGESILGGSGGR